MNERPPPTAEAIIMAAAMQNELSWAEIMTMRQEPHIVRGRHAAWKALREQRDERGRRIYTLVRIASWWGACYTSVQQATAEDA